jgi:N-acetyltransferase
MSEPIFNLQPTLTGDLLLLRPLQASDFEDLYKAASDPLIWDQHPAPRYERDVFTGFFEKAIGMGALVIIDRQTQAVVGTSRYYYPKPDEIFIGYTFLARSHWGGLFNRELKSLMIGYALKHVNNVFFDIGETNFRSRRAIEKIGGKFVRFQTVEGKPYTLYKIDRA